MYDVDTLKYMPIENVKDMLSYNHSVLAKVLQELEQAKVGLAMTNDNIKQLEDEIASR